MSEKCTLRRCRRRRRFPRILSSYSRRVRTAGHEEEGGVQQSGRAKQFLASFFFRVFVEEQNKKKEYLAKHKQAAGRQAGRQQVQINLPTRLEPRLVALQRAVVAAVVLAPLQPEPELARQLEQAQHRLQTRLQQLWHPHRLVP